MSKTYKIKVNQGQGEAKFVDIPTTGDGKTPMVVKAVPGGKYQLLDATTGYGPENIRASRSGKDLRVFFEGRSAADLVVEDYYEVAPEGFNGLIGEAETGRFYEYIPETAAGNTAVPLLADGSNQVGMALGGAEINASGAAVGVLAAAAFNPWLLAPLGLLGAAAGGGGGSSSTAVAATPKVTSAKLMPEDDTGPKDGITTDRTPRITGEATPDSDVSVVLNGKTYTGKASSTGVFVIQVPDADALVDGSYTPVVTSTLAGVKSPDFSGTPFKVDNGNGTDKTNAGLVLNIVSITEDTGLSPSDFHTADNTLIFKGDLDKFTANGDHVKLSLKNDQGVEVDMVYVKPLQTAGVWSWSWDRTNAKLADGKYTLDASIVNGAGALISDGSAKPTNTDSQLIYIDQNPQQPVVTLASLMAEDDTGPKDNVTTDKTPRISGKASGNADVAVLVNGKTYTGKASPTGEFVIQIPDADALPDGAYTPEVTATINGLKSPVFKGTEFKVDNAPTDKSPNAGVKLDITAITEDTGQNTTDFYTKDNQLIFKGTLSKYTENGDQVKLSLLDAKKVEMEMVYVKPVKNEAGEWTWSWDRSKSAAMADGQYTLNASLVNGAGTPVKDNATVPSTVDAQDVFIDTDKNNNHAPDKAVDPNSGFKVDILSATQDTGYSNKDFITKDRTLKFAGSITDFNDNGAFVEVVLKDATGKVVASDYVKPVKTAGVWGWTWDKQTDLSLVDGTYDLQASLVDKAGNPIHTDVQALVIDNSTTDNGGKTDPNANLKMLPVTFEDDTGINTTDYLTNDQLLTFRGGFDKDFVDNGDRVLVQVFGVDGKVVSQQYVLPSGKTWDFENLTKLGIENKTLTYTVKSVLVDAAGNTLQATDQSFVIDRSVSIFDDSGAKKEKGLWTFKSINYSTDEQGYYKYTTGSGVVEKKYTGGLFDLKDLEGKKFEIGAFSLEFKDWAGNSFTIANTTEVMDFTGATMATSSSTTVLPTPGFNVDQLVGSVGKIELKSSDAKDFDMASLYDGIPALGDLTAVNHVDITQGSHVLKLTMGDVLDLGVKNSFSIAAAHKDHLQMRIDGDAADTVNLDDLVGTTDFDWTKNNSAVTLGGKDYAAYTNDVLGLSLFVQTGITLNLI
ncbi:MAG: hypothetical protein CFE38_06275 [Comamonadaceae bacterium PBBC1]|nr:MAG: hypothetical protein CFE38_06275 [Comamonadaceae bacterium PBBC1]